MLSILARFRVCAALALVLAGVGFLFPGEGVRSVVGIAAVLLVLPLFLVASIDLLRNANSAARERRSVIAVTAALPIRLLIGLLGVCGLVFGIAIVLWILYNVLIERQEEFGHQGWMGFGVAPPMVLAGWHFLRIACGRREPAVDEELVDEEGEWDEEPAPR